MCQLTALKPKVVFRFVPLLKGIRLKLYFILFETTRAESLPVD